jgi:hypothetical protein
MKSGNLNFLEPSGPLQACNGTAVPLPLPLYIYIYIYGLLSSANNSLFKAKEEAERGDELEEG